MNQLKLITKVTNVEVRSNLVFLRLPQLNPYSIDEIVCRSHDGTIRDVTRYSGRYQVNATGLQGDFADFEFLVEAVDDTSESDQNKDTPAPPPAEKQEDNSDTQPEVSEKYHPTKSAWDIAQRKYKKQQALNRRRQEINNPSSLTTPNLGGKRVLTFGNPNCWARGLGLINKANQLKEQIGMPLHQYYHLITGQGYGAILAAALAAGIDLNRIMTWWTEDFKKVHTPNTVNGAMRTLVMFFNPNETGFSHKKAVKSLNRLYVKGQFPIRLQDVYSELQIKVIFGDLKVSTYNSADSAHGELTLAEVVTDAAITRNDFNSKATIKGEPPFLGEVEKNDVLGFIVSPQGEGMEITCIDAPVRIDPENAPSLEKRSEAAFKVVKQAQSQHIYQIRVEQIVQKLRAQGSNIKLLSLLCKPIDHIVRNSTTRIAQKAGISSGVGKITFPAWFNQTLPKRIVE